MLVSASCKKNNTNKLPPETHVGAFTFGCKVDGKVYKVFGSEGLLASEYVQYYIYFPDSLIHISVRSRFTRDFNFDFDIQYTGSPGIYFLKAYPYLNYGSFNEFGQVIYQTSLAYTGAVIIKYFDGSFAQPFSEGTLLAGTFEMDAVSSRGKVIHITEGRFDIGQ